MNSFSAGRRRLNDVWRPTGSDFEIDILEESDNLPDPDVIASKDSSEFRVPPIRSFEGRLRSK